MFHKYLQQFHIIIIANLNKNLPNILKWQKQWRRWRLENVNIQYDKHMEL